MAFFITGFWATGRFASGFFEAAGLAGSSGGGFSAAGNNNRPVSTKSSPAARQIESVFEKRGMVMTPPWS
jgi:hypothetical protein